MSETKTVMERLSEPLDKDDVELRIGMTSSKGFTLLPYKTARVDNKRLNEVCGLNWQERFYLDEGMNRCCELQIWNEDLKEWVRRSNVGKESNKDKEKGSYSDAKKRAGFELGIGAELYNAPTIWVNWNMKQVSRGAKTVWEPIDFYADNLRVTEYELSKGHFTAFTVHYDRRRIFQMRPPVPSVADESDRKAAWKTFISLLKPYGHDAKKFLVDNQVNMDDKDNVYKVVRQYINMHEETFTSIMENYEPSAA